MPFKILRVDELPQKPKTKKQYQEIGYHKDYLYDFPIVGVQTLYNKEAFTTPLEIIGTNHGIFLNPGMKQEHVEDKYRVFYEPEEAFLVRDSYPENHYDDYWQEGVDELTNQEVEIIVD